MKKNIFSYIVTAILITTAYINTNAGNIVVQSYGKRMKDLKKTEGVVNLQKTIPSVRGNRNIAAFSCNKTSVSPNRTGIFHVFVVKP